MNKKQCITLMSAMAICFSVHTKEVTLRAVSAFNLGTTFATGLEEFAKYVNKNGKGVIQINVIGGSEAIPPFELGNAVQSGVVDLAYNTSAYYTNLIPVADALHLSENSIQAQRKNGCYQLIDTLHQDKMNVKYLARIGDNIRYHLYTTKKIDGPDLKNLTIRTTPVYRPMFAKLGANLVRTAPAEVYSALERGSIDGYGFPSQGILDLGWGEKTKYRIEPAFYQVDVNLLINLDVWNQLTDEQRGQLEEAALWIEAKNADNITKNEAEYAKQAQVGIETISFEGKDKQKWLDTAREEGWAAVKQIDNALATQLESCLK